MGYFWTIHKQWQILAFHLGQLPEFTQVWNAEKMELHMGKISNNLALKYNLVTITYLIKYLNFNNVML